jgi:hypothetical protein
VGQQRRERDQLVEHRHRRRALRRPTDAEHLAILIEPNDPALGRDRVHNPDAVPVEQRLELAAERAEAPVCTAASSPSARTSSITNRPTGTSRSVARLGQQRLHRGVKRALTHHPDARHGATG